MPQSDIKKYKKAIRDVPAAEGNDEMVMCLLGVFRVMLIALY